MSTASSSSAIGLRWRCWILGCVSRQTAANDQTTPQADDSQEVSIAAATAGSSPMASLTPGVSEPWEAAACTVLHQRRRHPAGRDSPTDSSKQQYSKRKASANERRQRYRLLEALCSRLRTKRECADSAVPKTFNFDEIHRPIEATDSAPTQPGDQLLPLSSGDCVLVFKPDSCWHDGEGEETSIGWLPSTQEVPASKEAEHQPAKDAEACLTKSSNQTPLYRVRALHRFVANQAEELSFDRAELLDVVDEPDDDPDWLMAVTASAGGKQRGLIPRNYVEVVAAGETEFQIAGTEEPIVPVVDDAESLLESEEKSLLCLPFYWGGISRADADSLLMREARPGQFLVRPGESNPLDLTLTVRAQAKSRNFKIQRLRMCSPTLKSSAAKTSTSTDHQYQQHTCRYVIGQKQFETLSELIQHYSTHPIYRSPVEQCILGAPFLPSN